VLWDSIFAEFDGSKFELVDYIVVAMLIAIRHQRKKFSFNFIFTENLAVLSGDNTMCLTLLMRYPGAVDITTIIEHSLYLKEPDVSRRFKFNILSHGLLCRNTAVQQQLAIRTCL
jgi:hypothetical protein